MYERGVSSPLIFDPKDPKSASKTHQSFAKEADINNIMARYAKTGVLVDPLNVDSGRTARFGDYSDIADFTTMLNRINQAQADFMTLPASTRAKFDNDVSKCLDFISDNANLKEAVELKLLPESLLPEIPVPAPVPDPVPVSTKPS